jgi:serine/threonine protein kinase
MPSAVLYDDAAGRLELLSCSSAAPPPPTTTSSPLSSPSPSRSLADEVGIMASLDHVHLVRLAAFYADAGAYYIVTELMTGAYGVRG